MATFTRHWFDAATNEPVNDPRDHDAYARITCDEDGSRVTISAVGTSEYATCRRGHRWQHSFGPSGRYLDVTTDDVRAAPAAEERTTP